LIRIHSSFDTLSIHNMKNVLEGSGIECEIQDETRQRLANDVPVDDSFIELWIVDDERERDALKILEETTRPRSGSWVCPACTETIEATFDLCWKCSTPCPE